MKAWQKQNKKHPIKIKYFQKLTKQTPTVFLNKNKIENEKKWINQVSKGPGCSIAQLVFRIVAVSAGKKSET